MKNSELFLNKNSIAYDFIMNYEYPFEVLPYIKDFIVLLGSKLGDDFELYDDNVWVHRDADVCSTAFIKGPCIIDEGAQIRHGAFIRSAVIIGKNSVIGNSCEVKNSIIFDDVQVPHFNYVGDSILGNHSHMGAGSIISNVKADRKLVEIRSKDLSIPTEIKKVGAFLGDYVEVGCNAVLNPGTIIGAYSTVYPLVSVRGVIDSNSIVKDMKTIVRKEDR